MNRALQERCETIRALLAEVEIDEIAKRYEIAAIVAAVRDEKGTYGERSVEKIAAAIGRHAATLYRYAAVADLAPWTELRELCRLPNRDGALLSWSHWLELGRAPTGWRPFHARALAEAWSVRALAQELDVALAGGGRRAMVASDTTAVALAETLRAVRRFETEVTGTLAAVLERIERSPARERPEDVPELLARALDLIEATQQKTAELAARVRRLTTDPPQRFGAAHAAGATVARMR